MVYPFSCRLARVASIILYLWGCTNLFDDIEAFASSSLILSSKICYNADRYTWSLYNTGGWGIGPQREMVPEEFAKRSDNKRVFDGYKIRDRGEFMRQVQVDKENLRKDELDELLGVAQMAGIKVKDPKERLNKFESDIVDKVDDDELDLSISWGDSTSSSGDDRTKYDNSITRLDEDTGALGTW